MADAVVCASGLVKAYGKRVVLDSVDVRVEHASMTAVCGPSGCGKSTLLNIVGLLESADGGDLLLFGKRAPKPKSGAAQRLIREHVSYLFQNFALVETETVERNLLMAMRYVRGPHSEKVNLARRALDRVGLGEAHAARIHELSGGEQQRVALARCMVRPGELVLADEPTGSVDSKNREVIVGVLRRMVETGKTVLVVTHDDWVASRCDSVIRLE